MNLNDVINDLPERYHLIYHEFDEIFDNDFDVFSKHYYLTSHLQIRHILDTGKIVCKKRFSEN